MVIEFSTLVPVVIALVTALGAYFAASRKMSGKVQTSEASDLWKESRAMREELNKRNEFLRLSLDRCNERIAALEDRINDLEAKNYKLHIENGDLKRLVDQHEKTIARQAIRITDLESERDALKKRIDELENHGRPS